MYAQNYDPSSYDPSNFDGMSAMPSLNVSQPNTPIIDGVTRMQGNNLAQLDITVQNATTTGSSAPFTGTSQIVQLFNYINSVSMVNNAAISAFNPFTAEDVAASNANSLIYFNRAGALVYQAVNGTTCVVQCRQRAYKGLFESSSRTPFIIEKVRLTVSNDAQIDNEIFVDYQSFLNKVETNSINPRTYFNPYQNQAKIIDIPLKTLIDLERGLRLTVNAAETINIALFISAYKKLTIN
jgi:hypothetical protein